MVRSRLRFTAVALVTIGALLFAGCGGGGGKDSTAATTAPANAAVQASGSLPATASGSVGCSTMEQLAYHIHVHLAIVIDGQPVTVPANIGIRRDCIFWLHTHDPSGVIHVEAPANHTYTLGDFFQVWGQPLDATHLLSKTVDAGRPITTFVNGQPYDGSPASVPLEPHAVIVVEYGAPVVPPQPFNFPQGL